MSIRTLLMCSCVIATMSAPAFARLVEVEDVDVAPPPPQTEVVPAERTGYVWSPGYWSWEDHHYVWVKGRWVESHNGSHWVPEHWEQRDTHWHFVHGHWED